MTDYTGGVPKGTTPARAKEGRCGTAGSPGPGRTSSAPEVHAAIAGGPRATGPRLFELTDPEGRLQGPFNAMVLAPSVGLALQELGAAIRYRTGLTDRQREVAILALAAHRRSDFEAYAHEAVGRAVGLTDAELLELRAGRAPESLPDDERLVHAACTALLTERSLDDAAFAEASGRLGLAGLLEVVTLVGYYDTLDLIMRVAESPLPSGVEPPFGAEETGGR